MKILIVDDDLVQIQSLTRGLKAKGYEILSASNSKEALEILAIAHLQPDLLLTDLQMPDMDGIELLRSVRERGLQLPAIIMTAIRSKQLHVLVRNIQFAALLEKPFSLELLIHQIEKSCTSFADHESQIL